MQRFWWMALAMAGCTDSEAVVETPIVVPGAPAPGPAVDNPALYPALPPKAHGAPNPRRATARALYA